MIDAGTIPLKGSISRIIKYMDKYTKVGGACGEIEVFEPTDRELGYGQYRITDQDLIDNLNKSSSILNTIKEDPNLLKEHFEKLADDDIQIKIYKGEYSMVNDENWFEVKKRSCGARFEAK